MKKITYLLMSTLFLLFSSCMEDVNVDIPENIEKADITGVTIYDGSLKVIPAGSTINVEAKTVTIVLNATNDITKLKVSLTISTGATVIEPLGTGYLDFSSPKTVKIASPGKSIINDWTIQISNP